jgi:type II secretory pathway predicted ATPase ExeA
MYKHFFGLHENPFNANPDPRYLFLTAQTREALEELTYGIPARKGLILLTGEVGTGKTTLLNCLLDWLRQKETPTAFIFNSHLAISHLFDFMLADFGVPSSSELNGNPLMRLNQWLIERYRAGETPVLIVDEAQGLSFDLLEEIRRLLNLETPHEKLLQIVLAGQPELEERLQRSDLRQLKQRIALRCRTAALTLEETHDYIGARLHIAGANGKPIFAPEAVEDVHFYSRGIPRVVNLLCEHALINAYVDHVQPVPAHIIEEIAREFQFDDVKPLAPRFDSADRLYEGLTPMQSGRASALVQPSTSTEPRLCQKQQDASMTRVSAPFVVANVVPGATNRHAERVPDCEKGSAPATGNEISNAFGAAAPALAASGPRPIEAHQPSGSTIFDSAAAFHLLAKMVVARPALASSPPIRAVETKGGLDRSLTSSSSQVSSPSKPARGPAKVDAAKSGPLRRGSIELIPFRIFLARWSERWSDRLFSAVTSPTWTQLTATLFRSLKRPLHSVRALYSRWPAWRGAFRSMVGPTEWPRMKAVVFQWLRQPFNPMQWRLPYSRLFEVRRRLSYKKM